LNLYQNIYSIVKRIPAGSVSSYGRIAKMVDCTARQVGYAMAATPSGEGIPWHRVINSKGEISARKDGNPDQRQKKKLVDEGVVFDKHGRVNFDQYGWDGTSVHPNYDDWPEDWPPPDQWQPEEFQADIAQENENRQEPQER
jgi:methylated-DNA-protein-cysteine methyltransferase-like protein